MTDSAEQRLLAAFNEGRLVRPNTDEPSFTDLAVALAHVGGVPGVQLGRFSKWIADRLGAPRHLVFVLADGMGTHLLRRLPDDAFLRSHVTAQLNAVFPSTTGAALSTLATATYPAEHGLPGWWAYLQRHRLTVTTLPFVERYGETPLEDHGFDAGLLWSLPTQMARMRRRVTGISPADYARSTFTTYLCGDQHTRGYRRMPDAIDAAIDTLRRADEPSYTYVYLPQLDATCHRFGVTSDAAAVTLGSFDVELDRLAAHLPEDSRLVIAADHGLINVTQRDRLSLHDRDPMLDTLEAPPTGEPRNPVFHVLPGREDEFEALFNERFGERMILLRREQVERLRLLGPCALSERARELFGDYMAIAEHPVTLVYYPPGTSAHTDHLGRHAGLTPQEMHVPLIVV